EPDSGIEPGGNEPDAKSEPEGEGELDAGNDASETSSTTAPPTPLPACPTGRWCSALYPPTWTPTAAPDAKGRFLHDFSYAGYRYGEPPPSSPKGATYDVVLSYGADSTGQTDATSAIQAAINAASSAGGGVVFFRA